MTDDELSTTLLQIVNAGPTITMKAAHSLLALMIRKAPTVEIGTKVARDIVRLAEGDAVAEPETMQ